ncbi:hypothetical protein VAT7223_01307 [Vibrio atlanticus]|uniref:Uncharacterized protein n=1 Tax=Vibrio atlanticus TaxID=693153 RepID=A0A1C3IMQ0_9VIBR|nr:hypothetical protein VAT7223_01307 [Vibrio atlanticus]
MGLKMRVDRVLLDELYILKSFRCKKAADFSAAFFNVVEG